MEAKLLAKRDWSKSRGKNHARIILTPELGGTIKNSILTKFFDNPVWVVGCNNLLIENNLFKDGEGWIDVHTGDNISVRGNYFINITSWDAVRFWYTTSNGILDRNYFKDTSSTSALIMTDSTDFNVTNNHFKGARGRGLAVYGTGHEVFNNYFVDNYLNDTSGNPRGPQARCYGGVSWDDGNLGNYWSDYQYWYPTSTNDGITWNDPYVINEQYGAQDNHPLVAFEDTVPPLALTGPDIRVPQGTEVELNGSRSIDNVGVVDHSWVVSYGGNDIGLNGMTATFEFLVPGVYTVTLHVEDAMGLAGEKTMKVTVYDTEPPEADSGRDRAVDMGTYVVLNGTGSTDNGRIVSYEWTFEYLDENFTLIGSRSGFTFGAPGNYEIQLNVTDEWGNWAIDSFVLTVNDTESPVALAGDDIEVGQHEDFVLNGTASSDNIGVSTWSWTFTYKGEEVLLDGPIVTHSIDEVGVYVINLTVSDARDNIARDGLTVTVRDMERPHANAGEDLTVETGTTVTFDGRNSTDNVGVVSWDWWFEYDGEIPAFRGPVAEFAFIKLGTFEVILNVTDATGRWDTDSFLVTVTEVDDIPPVADAGDDIVADPDEFIKFDGTGSTDNVGIVNWTWTIHTDDTPALLYGEVARIMLSIPPGEYLTELTVRDASGNSDTSSIIIRIRDTVGPTAFAGEDLEVRVGLDASFDGSLSTDNMGVVNWTWSFVHQGFPVELYGVEPTFRFTKVDTYTVTLTVRDVEGLEASDTVTVTVSPFTGPDNGGDDGLPWYVLTLIAITVIGVLLGVVLMLRRPGEEA